MKDDPRLWAAIRKAVEVKLLPSHCSHDDYLIHIEMIRQVLAAADEAVPCPAASDPAPARMTVKTGAVATNQAASEAIDSTDAERSTD